MCDIASSERTVLRADVCIIGSGPAGLTLARGLLREGLSIVIVERGPRISRRNREDKSIVQIASVYRGATDGRAIGFGGTSSFWGGQLLPVRAEEMRRVNSPGMLPWPLEAADLDEHYRTVEDWFGVDALPFDIDFLHAVTHPAALLDWGRIAPRFSKWIAFRGRNLGVAWLSLFQRNASATVLLNTRIIHCAIHTAANEATIGELKLLSQNGVEIVVSAARCVIAAGALESSCLLERIVGITPKGPVTSEVIGRHLHDHLSLRVARVHVSNRRRFNWLFAPYFNGNTMRSLRIEVDPAQHDYSRIAAGYAHFVAETGPNSGFAVLRDTLRALQRQDWAALVRLLARLPLAIPGILEIGIWRYLGKRLPFVRGSSVFLHLNLEQPPSPTNTVNAAEPSLQAQSMHINWDHRFDPSLSLQFYRQVLEEFWARNCLDKVAVLEFLEFNGQDFAANLYDIFHPAGTTRMADSAAGGAVDRNLKAFGFTNLYVLSSGVFPSLGAANPTFTLLALALRLARHLRNSGLAAGQPISKVLTKSH